MERSIRAAQQDANAAAISSHGKIGMTVFVEITDRQAFRKKILVFHRNLETPITQS